jgi:hypothetical protein
VEAEAAVKRRRTSDLRRAWLGGLVVAVLAAACALSARAISPEALSETSLKVAIGMLGTCAPLALVIYGMRRHRIAVVVLAFCIGLSTNVVFLAHAVPAAAVTDNSSIFTFKSSSVYAFPSLDLEQNYTPGFPTSSTCPASTGYNWTCSFTSDTFNAAQTMSAGTAQADLYLENAPAPPPPTFRASGFAAQDQNANIQLNLPVGWQVGDLLLATVEQKDNDVVSLPAGWTLLNADNGSASHRASIWWKWAQAGEPSAVVTHSGNCIVGFMTAFYNIDATSPFDITNSWTYQTATDQDAGAGAVTTVTSNTLPVFTAHIADNPSSWTTPSGWTQGNAISSSDGTDCMMYIAYKNAPSGAPGVQPAVTLTTSGAANFESHGAQIALRGLQAAGSCNVTVNLSRPIQFRSADSNIANNSTTIDVNKPAGVIDGDVMIASIAFSVVAMPLTITLPSGWTEVRKATNGGGSAYGVAIFRKAASGEPSSYTWTFPSALYLAGGISAFSGVDNVTTVDVDSGGAGANAPSVTTTQPGDVVIASFFGNANQTFSPPAGMIEAFDRVTTSTTFTSVEQAYVLRPAPGATGSKTPTSGTANAAALTALRPAPGALLGSGTASPSVPSGLTLQTASIATPAVTFAAGDRLELDLIAPNDPASCGARLYYDGQTEPTKLTVPTIATVVPEGAAGLLLLAPALPLAIRRWKRRRP